MAVLNASAASLDAVVLDASSPANINYVKARMAIEESIKERKPRRAAKMQVISYLKGEIRHVSPAEKLKGHTNQVVFHDGSKARF